MERKLVARAALLAERSGIEEATEDRASAAVRSKRSAPRMN
jgi:hypothetical protein